MKRLAVLVLLAMLPLVLTGCVRTRSATHDGPSSDTHSHADHADNDQAQPVANQGAPVANNGKSATSQGTASDNKRPSRNTTLLMHPIDAIELGYNVRWATSINIRPKEKLASVSILEDKIVTVEHPTNLVSAVSLDAGKLQWRTAIGLNVDIAYAPIRIDDKIIVNTETNLYTLTADEGKFIARSDLRSPVRNSPAVIGEYVIFGGADGMVFAHDTRVGYEKWSYNLSTQILVSPVTAASQVFVGTATGRYASFAAREGKVLWQGRAFDKIIAQPTVGNLGIFVASEDGNLYCLSRRDGEDRWIYRYTAPLRESPIALKSVVYQPLPTGELLALQATNGKEIWTIKTKSRPIAHTSRGLIFVADGKLEIRDPATGKVINDAPTKKLQKVIPVGSETLILVSADGRMMRLDAE